jgi:hypothetical protein
MLLDADARITDKLVEEIELELDRSFEAGMRAASHAAPLIEADFVEVVNALNELCEAVRDQDNNNLIVINRARNADKVLARIRALKEQP